MIEKVIKLSCGWCGECEECSVKGIGLKRMRKNENRRGLKDKSVQGWFTLLMGEENILDFCCQEC